MQRHDFGRFELLRHLGTGGMAEIYLANAFTPSGLAQRCVIKRLRTSLQNDKAQLDMFLTEADVCTFLHHDNLINVYEAGEVDGQYYIAMEYADGFELQRLMDVLAKRDLPCPVGLAVMLGMKLARALDYLHRATSLAGTPLHLVHRDVNPTNIYILHNGQVKLGDLGVARIAFLESHTGPNDPIKGKLRYLAPELLMRKEPDPTLDIYGVGVTLHELLSRQKAFVFESEQKTMMAICNEGLPKLGGDTPRALRAIIAQATHIERGKRFKNAAELYRELRRVMGETAYSAEETAGFLRSL